VRVAGSVDRALYVDVKTYLVGDIATVGQMSMAVARIARAAARSQAHRVRRDGADGAQAEERPNKSAAAAVGRRIKSIVDRPKRLRRRPASGRACAGADGRRPAARRTPAAAASTTAK
jgi:hypothetical protein